jgi:hypothetical protein
MTQPKPEPGAEPRTADERQARELYAIAHRRMNRKYKIRDMATHIGLFCRAALATPKTPAMGVREYKHWLYCNGDRRYPAGEPGHSCCCFNDKHARAVSRYVADESRQAPPAPEGRTVTDAEKDRSSLREAPASASTASVPESAEGRKEPPIGGREFDQFWNEEWANDAAFNPDTEALFRRVAESAWKAALADREAPDGGEVGK